MSYTTLSHCKLHYERQSDEGLDLTSAAIRFLHDACQDLRFSEEKEREERLSGILLGKSLKPHQISYNMEMDIDRLCLENAVKRFAESGAAKDAFDIYFCYLEMFVGAYDCSRRMIELLSEFESNGSSLLMKHRDHYSHSVYVFMLGLAIYETNEKYRSAYQSFYKIMEPKKAAHHFLQFWGLASLFHDIGYPFELPYEQAASYFEANGGSRADKPFITYQALDNYVRIKEEVKGELKKIYGTAFDTINDLFAYDMADRLSDSYKVTAESMREILTSRPTHPERCGNFMDHGYFSATILFKKLFDDMECQLTRAHIDAMTAILLHNSLYKFDVAFYKDKKKNYPAFRMELQPLAYMLMLCDELQCWDRTSYGRNSRVELHPMDCSFTFLDGGIQAAYLYDIGEKAKIERFEAAYQAWKAEEPTDKQGEAYQVWKKGEPKLKAYSGMAFENDFRKNIEAIVDLSEISLSVETRLSKKDNRKKKTYLSNSSFINLYHFAVALNGRWQKLEEWQQAEANREEEEFLSKNMNAFLDAFKKLSLEYKLSNINQAKAFAKYLDVLDCFYTDKPVDYDILEHFEPEQTVRIGHMEHERWLREHYEMGWQYGEKLSGAEREQKRVHADMIPDGNISGDDLTKEMVEENYNRLGKGEQDKDIAPMDAMLTLLKMFEGLRIYKIG